MTSSKAIQKAVKETVERHDKKGSARECAKLDPVFEQIMADEGLDGWGEILSNGGGS